MARIKRARMEQQKWEKRKEKSNKTSLRYRTMLRCNYARYVPAYSTTCQSWHSSVSVGSWSLWRSFSSALSAILIEVILLKNMLTVSDETHGDDFSVSERTTGMMFESKWIFTPGYMVGCAAEFGNDVLTHYDGN